MEPYIIHVDDTKIIKERCKFFREHGTPLVMPYLAIQNNEVHYANIYKMFKIKEYGNSSIDLEAVLIALCHMEIVGVGNVGLHNVLLECKNKKVFILDYSANGESDFFASLPKSTIIMVRRYPSVVKKLIEMKVNDDQKIRLDKLIKQFQGNRGLMYYDGAYSLETKTFSGYTIDIIKSALQKYVRRGIVDKAVIACIEMYRLGELGGDPVITNLINRIKIIAVEDIGIASYPAVMEVLNVLEVSREIDEIVACVHLLCESKKTRTHCYIWSAHIYNRDMARSFGIEVGADDWKCAINDEDRLYVEENRHLLDYNLPDDNVVIALVFRKRIIMKNFDAYNWIYYYYQLKNKINRVPKFRNLKSNQPIVVLWLAIKDMILNYDIMLQNHLESEIHFFQTVVFQLLVGLESEYVPDFPLLIKKNKKMVKKLLNGEYDKFIIDDYCIDQHTIIGKSQGKGRNDFINEGSVIQNEDMQYNYPKYQMYRDKYDY